MSNETKLIDFNNDIRVSTGFADNGEAVAWRNNEEGLCAAFFGVTPSSIPNSLPSISIEEGNFIAYTCD